VYALGGACFGLAGVLQCARIDAGEPTVAIGLELDVIAAVIVGGASLSGGVGTVMGSIIGALLMAVLRNGSQQLHRPTYEQEIIIGAAIVIAALVDRLRTRRG
nr:ABC transporter permease [Planctomycetota bacterium]